MARYAFDSDEQMEKMLNWLAAVTDREKVEVLAIALVWLQYCTKAWMRGDSLWVGKQGQGVQEVVWPEIKV